MSNSSLVLLSRSVRAGGASSAKVGFSWCKGRRTARVGLSESRSAVLRPSMVLGSRLLSLGWGLAITAGRNPCLLPIVAFGHSQSSRSDRANVRRSLPGIDKGGRQPSCPIHHSKPRSHRIEGEIRFCLPQGECHKTKHHVHDLKKHFLQIE